MKATLGEPDTLEELNAVYSDHKENFYGEFHNLLWQIMINKSCTGCFWAQYNMRIVIAQRDGGYVDGCCAMTCAAKQEEVLADLNKRVFGLSTEAAEEILGASFRNNKR